jgi:hypothetical protein
VFAVSSKFSDFPGVSHVTGTVHDPRNEVVTGCAVILLVTYCGRATARCNAILGTAVIPDPACLSGTGCVRFPLVAAPVTLRHTYISRVAPCHQTRENCNATHCLHPLLTLFAHPVPSLIFLISALVCSFRSLTNLLYIISSSPFRYLRTHPIPSPLSPPFLPCPLTQCSLATCAEPRSVEVTALCCKPQVRGYETRLGECIPPLPDLRTPSDRTRPWGLLSL